MCGGGHAWQGTYMAGGMHSRGHAWLGVCMAGGRACVAGGGGVDGRGASRLGGTCVAGETGTAASCMHPTGMHSC